MGASDVPPPGLTKLGEDTVDDGVEEVEVIEGAVPRCGPGGGGDGTPIWIPASLADRVSAPREYVKQQTD